MYNKLKIFFNNKAVENGIWLYMLQFFNRVIPFLTLPYITRILGPSQYGIFTISLNLIGYLQVLIEYGFNFSGTRKVALSENKKDVNTLFNSILYSRIILLIISALVVITYINIRGFSPIQSNSILILLLGLIGTALQQSWLFQGLQEMKFISISQIISRTTSTILIFLFVKDVDDLLLYCLLYSLSPIFNGILGTILALKRYGMSLISINKENIFNEIKDGWYIFTTSISSRIFSAVGITFLSLFSTNEVVGTFSAIQKIPNIILLIWSPISQILYPISSKKMNDSFYEGKKQVYTVRKKIIIPLIIVAITISLFSKSFVNILYGPAYVHYHYWIYPLLMWLVISINNNFLGIQILLASGHDKEYSKSFQIGLIATLAFNLILIYFFEGDGAALSPLLSELVLMISLRYYINRL